MAETDYHRKLNEWHLELSIVEQALGRVLFAIEDEEFGAIGHVLKGRLHELVETCPFPPAELVCAQNPGALPILP
uniref:Uncharacterized protein n=1 Tax=uncultured prokaryote TaxID=198431 RepID=A0A0H5Q2H8_9ZZZZ|nr:hypothetical protein [uncultured prokaryote]